MTPNSFLLDDRLSRSAFEEIPIMSAGPAFCVLGHITSNFFLEILQLLRAVTPSQGALLQGSFAMPA